MDMLCRSCLERFSAGGRCPSCASPRVVSHPELFHLTIAHMDCDAFYASVEKRDNPDLRDKPVIIGGGRRGVVSTACYIARIKGVCSAMPMFQALKLCPEAVVLRGRMEVYAAVSAQIRQMMEQLTPAVEPLSMDEAFMDLSGTEKLHGAAPAVLLAGLVNRIERELGISASIGLSHNKFLAKIASDLDKPRGFSVIGAAQTRDFLHDKPVSIIWGVGRVTQDGLARAGIHRISDLLRWDKVDLHARFGSSGSRLWHLARGEDMRPVSVRTPVKSISHETTFPDDTMDRDVLDGHIWRLSEKVADRAKAKAVAGRVVILKLKRADFKLLTRRVSRRQPTQIADQIYRTAREMFAQIDTAKPYRLIGVGLGDLVSEAHGDLTPDLLDPHAMKRAAAERASDRLRQRFGPQAVIKGRSLR